MSESKRLENAELESLERQLAGLALPVSAGHRDQLLYACGCEAGRAHARRSLRRWATAAAAVGLVAGGLFGSVAGPRASKLREVESAAKPPVPANQTPANAPAPRARFESETPGNRSMAGDSGGTHRGPDELRAGLRLELALVLLDAAPAETTSAASPLDGSDRPPLKPISRDLRQ